MSYRSLLSGVSDIFTQYDESIAAEIARDPLGMQVIWTEFGQRIFANRTTSVATDIRNYTINLFHHYVLYQWIRANRAFSREIAEKLYSREIDLTCGIIILLENILIHSFCELNSRGSSGIDSKGILGTGNGMAMLQKGAPRILSPDHRKEVLVRQISLGINGRYKGPFIQMGIFDSAYDISRHPEIWERIDRLFDEWKSAKNLADTLVRIISERLFRSKQLRKIPEISFDDICDEALLSLYAACFGKPSGIPRSVHDFWIEQLGFSRGAAGAIFRTVDRYKTLDSYDCRQILNESLQNKDCDGFDAAEKRKIEDILSLEPFLSVIVSLFNCTAVITTKDLRDVRTVHSKVRDFDLSPLALLPDKPKRLSELISLFEAKAGDCDGLISGLHAYHKKIMDERGMPPWFEIDSAGKITHTGRSLPAELKNEYESDDFDGREWLNPYYIDSVRSIARGMGGVQ